VDLPVLSDFHILEQHFNWVCDGGIRQTVERKMVNELRLMEAYLLHQGKEALTNIITTYANDCNQHIDESGSTYSWVGILRAGEKHWGTVPENALFRTELEGINGTSPQLIIKTRDRYASETYFLNKYHHKVLTYVEDRAVSSVFQNIAPPPPIHPASVSAPRTKGRVEGGWGSIF
jgi:hypothetical protein